MKQIENSISWEKQAFESEIRKPSLIKVIDTLENLINRYNSLQNGISVKIESIETNMDVCNDENWEEFIETPACVIEKLNRLLLRFDTINNRLSYNLSKLEDIV
jgi:hypothetical protein